MNGHNPTWLPPCVYKVTADGRVVSLRDLYMVDPDDHAYRPDCHCQECVTERQAMS